MVCFRGLFSLLKTLKSRVLPKSKLYKTINTLIISLLPQNSTKSFFLTLILDSFKIKLKEALSWQNSEYQVLAEDILQSSLTHQSWRLEKPKGISVLVPTDACWNPTDCRVYTSTLGTVLVPAHSSPQEHVTTSHVWLTRVKSGEGESKWE